MAFYVCLIFLVVLLSELQVAANCDISSLKGSALMLFPAVGIPPKEQELHTDEESLHARLFFINNYS